MFQVHGVDAAGLVVIRRNELECVEPLATVAFPIALRSWSSFGSMEAISTESRQTGRTINQVCLIHGAAKQLPRRLFVRKNRPDPRQPLFCLAACVVEQDRVHARKQR